METAGEPITQFAAMLINLRCREELEQWITDAEACGLPELRGFAPGLRKDWDAVLAGLSLHWTPAPWKATSTASC